MVDRFPPLTALRAFEAAARHLSFARAAAELHVTPAALSFQIKSLEAELGQPVFRRLNRAIELTEAGRALLPGAREGFAALRGAWAAARRLTDTRGLTITAGPAITSKWLAPRLFNFARQHPEIELRFSASLRIMEFGRDEMDVAIRFGLGPYPGLTARPLLDDWSTPVMTPELSRRYPDPARLQEAVLLHQGDLSVLLPDYGWTAWFASAGLPPPPAGGPSFSQADHAVDAALSGAGVVLGRFSVVHDALRAGTLVAPFPLALRCPARFWFLCEAGAETRPHVAAFHDWVMAEVAAMKKFDAGRVFAAVAA